MTLAGGTPIGKYVVRRKLAEGGMAEIFLCSSVGPEGFEKEVVIKRVRQALAADPGFVQMFIREARLASRLSHPNVVHIYDFDKHDDTYYLAMEYVRGASLYDLRKRCKQLMEPIGPLLAAQIALEVARGLGYAHRLTEAGKPLNLVHRDVTPHNVLLSFEGAVKLTDFGIARAGSRLTAAGTLKGKFAYMSPEQARGDELDSRTDLFALGIVLWEMLTGGRLFDADSDVGVLKAVQQSAIPAPRRLNPDVPEALDAIVLKALEREPARRFQSAPELERALGQFLLKEAQRVEDTDVGAFLRKMFPEEAARESTRLLRAYGAATADTPGPQRVTPGGAKKPVREPTAVMNKPGSRGGGFASPDEDPHASTMRVQRRLESAPTPAAPPASETSAARSAIVSDASVPTLRDPAPKGRKASFAIAGAILGLVVVIALVTSKDGPVEPAEAPTAVVETSTEPDPEESPPSRGDDSDVGPADAGSDATGTGDAVAVLGGSPDAGPPALPAPPVESAPKPERPSRAPQADGRLVIRALPWAQVTIDGVRYEVRGHREIELPPGIYTLEQIRNDSRSTAKVVVRPGKRVVHTVRFR